jgi:molybdopterin/thiamine biosynthesis adenylyltransferase
MALSSSQISRYARHLTLREVGGAGQNALLSSNVALVGAGGLGGPAGLYLAAAGVGRVTLIDDDVVEASNLQRQVQFIHTDIGMGKAQIMGDTLEDLNPDCRVTRKTIRLTDDNAMDLLSGHDVILDGTDSFEARFAINAASFANKIPLVSGALGRFDLQLGVFNLKDGSPCYRCFVHEAPDIQQDCATHGVLGAIAGMGGSMMAMEAIKLITGAGEPLDGRLYVFDALRAEGRTIGLARDLNCPLCGAA